MIVNRKTGLEIIVVPEQPKQSHILTIWRSDEALFPFLKTGLIDSGRTIL